MKKRKWKGILISLAVIMLIGSLRVPSFASEIDKAKEEKSDLEKKKEETELKISELEKAKDDILKYIEELDKELNRLAGEIESLNSDIETAEDELKTAQQELEAARIAEENQYTIMKNRIKYMYENGQSNYLEIILSSENLSDALNQVEYMSKITEYDNSLLDKYIASKQEVTRKEEAQQAKLTELNELKDELTFEQGTVERLVEDKNEEVVKYEANISENQSLSEQYSSKLDEQEQIIEQLLEEERQKAEAKRKAEEERKRKEQEQQAASGGGTSEGGTTAPDNSQGSGGSFSGNFIWPVPSSSRITSSFGSREQPTEGASTYHKGIDIGAPSGSSVIAAASGTVITATYSVSAGNYIMLSHGDGIYTVYMHCSKLFVAVGDEVSQGQQIALVGSTGISTGSHLHFGVSKDGTYINPLDYVSN